MSSRSSAPSAVARLSSGLFSAFAAVPSLAAAQGPAPGFAIPDLPQPGGVVLELASGDLVNYDGQFVRHFDPAGVELSVLADLGGPNFGGIFELDPSETFLIVGESSQGDVWRVELDGSGFTFLNNVFFNFDAEFAPDGRLYVSAATGGFFTGNDILRLDTVSGAIQSVAQVSGPSGPLTFDSAGNLYYATQSDSFPAPPGATDLLIFLAASLDVGLPLDENDAFPIGVGFDGASTLACDRTTDAIYLAETNSGTGLGRILQVVGGPDTSVVLMDAPAFHGVTIESFRSGTGPMVYAPYQPLGGGRLTYRQSDFSTFDGRRALLPARPTLGFSGPGTAGVGAVHVITAGFEPLDLVFYAFGPTSQVGAELALPGAVPLFVGLGLGTLQFWPTPVTVDGNGDATLPLFHPGGLHGLVSFQALGVRGSNVLGTSPVANF
jgi:hypothetical protein